ncbi:MAG: endonuclease/exonuclease/phosphatase family protein [Clostridia bacterium]|nr:endonuclease/exonuclease/phosphatase family protein [Clostridia bacterium]
MSKAKKIILIVSVCVIVAAAALVAIFMPDTEKIYDELNKKAQPAQVVDFEEKAEGAIRVMTFNVRCFGLENLPRKAREYYVAETVRKGMPDSFGVQEATPTWMKYLEKELSDKYAYVGVGRSNGKNSGEYSAVFYLKDKYELVDSDTFWLSETPEKPSKGWDANIKRICTWAVLENKETGEKYVHLNAHFDHQGEEARKNSVDMILEKAKEYKDLPVVFTADMNIVEGTEHYESMVADGTLKDTKYTAEDTMDYLTFHDLKPAENEGRILDYVMVNDKFDANVYKVVTAGVDGRFVSDHYPVYADIVIR